MNRFAGKRVLITGASGLIGSHLTKRLLEENAYVFAMGRSEDKMKHVFCKEWKNEKFACICQPVSQELPNGLGEIDYIFHAASPISGTEIKTKPVDTISANLDGIKKCLEYIKRQKKGRVIVFSSATVYGNVLSEETVVGEEDTIYADALHTANTPYSESKRMTEVLARAYSIQEQVDVVIARISYVYGFSNPSPNTAFYEFIGKATRGENITLNNSGMGRRDNIHVNDVVNGLLTIAQDGVCGEAYNISSNGDMGNYKAIDEIAEIIATSIGEVKSNYCVKANIKPLEGPRNPGIRLNNEKLKRLGWEIEISLEEGIKETLEKYLSIQE